MKKFGVGFDMLPSKTTLETLDAAAKVVEKAKAEIVKKKKDKERKDGRIPPGGRGQPRSPGLGRGRRGGGGGGGRDVVRHFNPSVHRDWGWNGGGNQGYHSQSQGHHSHSQGPPSYYNGGSFPHQAGRAEDRGGASAEFAVVAERESTVLCR